MEIKTPYIEIRNKKYETKDFNIKVFEIGTIFIIKFTKGNDIIYFGTNDLKNLIKLKPKIESEFIEKDGDFIIETKIIGYEKDISYIEYIIALTQLYAVIYNISAGNKKHYLHYF